MNIVAILYAALITFVTGILITNYLKIEKFVTQVFIHIDAYSVGYTISKVVLGVAYLSIPVVLYQLRKARIDNSLHTQTTILNIKKTLICLIGIVLISKEI